MGEFSDIKVPIRKEFEKRLIFGLNARPPIALVLSFFGFRHEVMLLMQTASHTTRAFIWNADGLPGFVIEMDVK